MSNNKNGVIELSDYEKVRAHNIERNNAKLRSLGLISAFEQERSNQAAWGRVPVVQQQKKDIKDKNAPLSSSEEEKWAEDRPKKKQRRQNTGQKQGSRKSLRLQGISVSGTGEDNQESVQHERKLRVQECREARQRAAIAFANNNEEAGGKKTTENKNPTATYEHCLMRVQTMSEKGLMNRVKAIERAAGKHCVIKMGIFKCCLQDEGMWDLAEQASLALERLKALQPPPKDE